MSLKFPKQRDLCNIKSKILKYKENFLISLTLVLGGGKFYLILALLTQLVMRHNTFFRFSTQRSVDLMVRYWIDQLNNQSVDQSINQSLHNSVNNILHTFTNQLYVDRNVGPFITESSFSKCYHKCTFSLSLLLLQEVLEVIVPPQISFAVEYETFHPIRFTKSGAM